jgi:hypothetical protein
VTQFRTPTPAAQLSRARRARVELWINTQDNKVKMTRKRMTRRKRYIFLYYIEVTFANSLQGEG